MRIYKDIWPLARMEEPHPIRSKEAFSASLSSSFNEEILRTYDKTAVVINSTLAVAPSLPFPSNDADLFFSTLLG